MRNHDPSAENKSARMMGRAVPHALRQPSDPDDLRPVDKPQAAARSLAEKAVAGHLSAIKEVRDRIAGNAATAVNERGDGAGYASERRRSGRRGVAFSLGGLNCSGVQRLSLCHPSASRAFPLRSQRRQPNGSVVSAT